MGLAVGAKCEGGPPVVSASRFSRAPATMLVANADELRPLGSGTVGPEIFGEALAREIDDAVGGREDRLRRAIVPVRRETNKSTVHRRRLR